MINIAVDGTVGSGKSTVTKELARLLNLKVLDTGAIYRGIACEFKKKFSNNVNDENVEKILKKLKVQVEFEGENQKVIVNDFDYTPYLRTEEISSLTSRISPYPKIREKVLTIQRKFASDYNSIMEGRDIGTVVLPKADVKIFLTATQEERAKRRYDQIILKDNTVTLEKILEDLKVRDYNDEHREIAPLKPAEDAIFVDNTGMTLQETVKKLYEIIQEKVNIL